LKNVFIQKVRILTVKIVASAEKRFLTELERNLEKGVIYCD